MSFLERFLIDGTLGEGKLRRAWVQRMVSRSGEIDTNENMLLGSYFLGYWLVQYFGYREDYKKGSEPEWLKRIFLKIPPLKQVISAAEMTTRIGKELINESIDFQHILQMSGKFKGREIRNLGNLLAGIYSRHDDDIAYPEMKLDREQIITKCFRIIDNWFLRHTNRVDINVLDN